MNLHRLWRRVRDADRDHRRRHVVVTNTADSPVPVSGTVGVSKEITPFQLTLAFDDWDGQAFRTTSRGVPEGKLLVIEYVSVSAAVPPGQQVRASVSGQGVGVGLSTHKVVMLGQGRFGGNDLYVGADAVRAYAFGGSGIGLSAVRTSDSGNGGRIEFSLSGHLIDR